MAIWWDGNDGIGYIWHRIADANFAIGYKKLRMRDSYTNPYESKRIESFEIFGLTKRIHDTNLLKKGLRIESTIRILKVRIRESKTSGFVSAIVLRIRKDSLDWWKQVESFENWLDSWSRFETNLLKSGFVIHNTIWIFLSPDLWPTNRYESMDSQNKSMFLRISYTNPASLQKMHSVPLPMPTMLTNAYQCLLMAADGSWGIG